MPFTKELTIADLKVFIEADTGHLLDALKHGQIREAHAFVDEIDRNTRHLKAIDAETRSRLA